MSLVADHYNAKFHGLNLNFYYKSDFNWFKFNIGQYVKMNRLNE
jgi:hypothetical protein